jgi:hypothetical protein
MVLQGEVAVAAGRVVAELPWKTPVRVATTSDISIANGLNAGDSIDDVTLVAGDRVLVWRQVTQSQNGIYVVDAAPFRAPDFDADEEIRGALVHVIAGTTYAGDVFVNTNLTAITVDTTAITFERLIDAIGASSSSHTHPPSADGHSHNLLGPLLLASDHASPIVFDDILQASDGRDFLYASEP